MKSSEPIRASSKTSVLAIALLVLGESLVEYPLEFLKISSAQAAESSTKKLWGLIGNITLTELEGCRAATMLRAWWMLWAFTSTVKRAVLLCTSIETCII